MTTTTIEPGQILCAIWGCDQTTATFFKVIARKGKWATVERIGTKNDWRGDMTGTAVPCDAKDELAINRRPAEELNPLRRKIRHGDDTCGYESIKIKPWGMYASLWDGKPVQVSCYA